ncbi:hypothetical protein EVAR_61136_1 [Eumeta japonica]|uniref:Uncharacterized protein n=1 Tax=Eumeta variegata TaxID=151549 RepID=A0A4C2ABF3_EUMVA|nr:hypothetical protein EVAR_61136_1 [Eumeta japonica]
MDEIAAQGKETDAEFFTEYRPSDFARRRAEEEIGRPSLSGVDRGRGPVGESAAGVPTTPRCPPDKQGGIREVTRRGGEERTESLKNINKEVKEP